MKNHSDKPVKSRVSFQASKLRKTLTVITLLVGILLVPLVIQHTSHTNTVYGALGQPMWNGVSSFLFGANDTEEWDSDNFQTNAPIQAMLKKGHIDFIRSFFFHWTIYDDASDHRTTIGTDPQNTTLFPLSDYTNPAPQANQLPGDFYEIQARIHAVEQAGATCLGVLPNITTDPNTPDTNPAHTYVDPSTGKVETDLAFDEKVLAYLGNRCNYYEFGNEPDLNGVSESEYVQKWDEFVSILKHINPNAKFFGPVTADFQGEAPCTYPAGQAEQCYMNTFLRDVASGKVIPSPEGITFHNYSDADCADGATPGPNCLINAPKTLTASIKQVRAWMTKYLGTQLPLGITEWNATPGEPQYMVKDTTFASKYTTAMLNTMIADKLDFANQFDIQSGSGCCYLDMFNSCNGTDQPTGMETALARLATSYYQRNST